MRFLCSNKYDTTNVRWGITRDKNLSSQLDSATVVLTQVTSMNIEPYDFIQLVNENNGVEYWLVANVSRDYVTYEAPYLFDYTVDLMSLTKFLETIMLPSMGITNIGQNRTIKSYIQRIVTRYVLPQLSTEIDSADYTSLDARFDSVCPEQTFQQTTAREYLDWLAGIYGCCIQITYAGLRKINVGVLDLNQDRTAIDSSIINSIKDSQSASDYVTELEHNMQDVIAQNTITEYVKLKSDSYVFNSDNAVGILSHKPYDITKIVLKSSMKIHKEESYNNGTPSVSEYTVSNIDLTDYFLPEKVFRALNFNVDAGTTTIADHIRIRCTKTTPQEPYFPQKGNKYQLNTMYWNRGSDKLLNINTTTDFQAIFGSNYTMPVICAAVIWKWLETNFEEPVFSGGTNYRDEYYWIEGYDWSNVLFEVTYVPYISPRLKVEQKDSFSHLITMPDNSTNTQTELSKFLAYSLEKNSKLGNKSKILTAKSNVVNGDYTPKLEIGQYWLDENGDKYILSTLEYSTHPNSIIYKGTLTKNYTNQNIYTSINREKRYFSLPDASEVVTRKEVIKEYYQIKNVSSVSGLTIIPASKFTTKPLFMAIRSTLGDGTYIHSALVTDTVYGGNLVAHSASYVDNISYGSEATDITTTGIKMNVKKYVDDNGEAVEFAFEFRIRNSDNGPVSDAAMMNNLAIGEVPNVATTTSLTGTYNLSILKDAREKISITVEKIFYAGANNITIGNNFAELFNNTNELIWVLYYYTNGGGQQAYEVQMPKSQFLGGLWRLFLPQDTAGTLIVRKNKNNTASTYLTVSSYYAGDYIVILEATKRG